MCENQLRFDKVTESIKVGTFIETQCSYYGRLIGTRMRSIEWQIGNPCVPCIAQLKRRYISSHDVNLVIVAAKLVLS